MFYFIQPGIIIYIYTIVPDTTNKVEEHTMYASKVFQSMINILHTKKQAKT